MHDIENYQRDRNIDRQKQLDRAHKMIRNRIQMKIIAPQDRHITGDPDADNVIDDQTGSSVKQFRIERFSLLLHIPSLYRLPVIHQ